MPRRIVDKQDKCRPMSVSAEPRLIEAFHQAAASEECSTSVVFRRIIREYIKKIEKKSGKRFLRVVFFFFSVVLVTSLTSAGLTVNQTSFSVNKSSSSFVDVYFQVTNTEAFDFVNISLEGNSGVLMNTIEILHPGETKNVTARIMSGSSSNTSLRVQGLYFLNIGQSFQTYDIDVNFSNPPALNPCDFSIISGDTVRWWNRMQFDSMVMFRNTGQSVGGSSTTPSQSYQIQYNQQETFRYYWARFSFPITPVCAITVLSPNTWVYNPQYDAIMNFNIQVQQPPTSLTVSPNPTSFNIGITETHEGTILIQNTGVATAFDIHLDGDWMSFSANDFDLAPSQSRGIIFSVHPQVLTTNETNKTYSKILRVMGNFNTYETPISVFVKFANIGLVGTNASIEELLLMFCAQQPFSPFCGNEPKIEYRYIFNSSDQEVNVTVTQNRLNDIFAYMFSLGDDMRTNDNFMKQQIDAFASANNLTAADVSILKSKVEEAEAARLATTKYILYFAILVFVLFSCVVIVTLIYIYKTKKAVLAVRKWN